MKRQDLKIKIKNRENWFYDLLFQAYSSGRKMNVKYPRMLSSLKEKIRHCFFSTNQAKVANCVSASASAQHIEAPINTNNNFADS
jgi:hypothetical protein